MSADLELLPEEEWVIRETLRTGNLNLFTAYFMRLPNSGSMWMPGDRIGHYRELWEYEQLFDAWTRGGQPDEFDIQGEGHIFSLRVVWDGIEPTSATCSSIGSSPSSTRRRISHSS